MSNLVDTRNDMAHATGKFDGYDNPEDILSEQMIQSFKLSTKELLICNEMSVSKLIVEYRDYSDKLKTFKKTVEKYCLEMGFV